jgi:hypothetical protein
MTPIVLIGEHSRFEIDWQQFGNNVGNVIPMRLQCGRAVIVTFFTRK